MKSESILYTKEDAQALTNSESTEEWREYGDQLKADLIIQHLPEAKSLLDIGCAWGQVLLKLRGHFSKLAGVDESSDRLSGLINNEYGIDTYVSHSSTLPISDSSFDAVLTSHIMHEVKLFGTKQDLTATLSEIRRVLSVSGKYVLIDHRDPEEGEVSIKLTPKVANYLETFAKNFKYRHIDYSLDGDIATLSVRDCHDFVTKIWSIGTGAEDLEMNETHTIMHKDEIIDDLESNSFEVIDWIPFNDISMLMQRYGIKLTNGQSWPRQFLCISQPR